MSHGQSEKVSRTISPPNLPPEEAHGEGVKGGERVGEGLLRGVQVARDAPQQPHRGAGVAAHEPARGGHLEVCAPTD